MKACMCILVAVVSGDREGARLLCRVHQCGYIRRSFVPGATRCSITPGLLLGRVYAGQASIILATQQNYFQSPSHSEAAIYPLSLPPPFWAGNEKRYPDASVLTVPSDPHLAAAPRIDGMGDGIDIACYIVTVAGWGVDRHDLVECDAVVSHNRLCNLPLYVAIEDQ